MNSIHTLQSMLGSSGTSAYHKGRRVRAIPQPYPDQRIRAALAVLFGKAYAVQWPKLGEFEAIQKDKNHD